MPFNHTASITGTSSGKFFLINASTHVSMSFVGYRTEVDQDTPSVTAGILQSQVALCVTFQVSARKCTTCTVPILCEQIIKTFYPICQTTRIKKKQDVYNDLHTLWNYFFQPNLTNDTLKESQEDPYSLHWVEYGKQFVEKNQYDNKNRYPKFGMDTQTKEIVMIKQRYGFSNIINV